MLLFTSFIYIIITKQESFKRFVNYSKRVTNSDDIFMFVHFDELLSIKLLKMIKKLDN